MASNQVGVVNTGSFPKRMWPGVNLWYGDEYAQFMPQYVEIFDVKKSDKLYEEFVAMCGTGYGLVKPEGQPIQFASFRQALTTRLVNVMYGLGFVITKEVQADDQYAKRLVEIGSRNLAKSMLQLKELLGANVLNNGFSVDAAHIGGDGLALFSTAHTTVSGTTYRNRPTADADLSEAALEQMCIDLGTQSIDEAGLRINVMPKKLIVPPALQFTADRLLKTPLRPGTADNDINAMKNMGLIPQGYVVNNYLSSAKAWFVKTDNPNGLVMLEREGYETEADNEFTTKNARFTVTERYIQSFIDPRGAYASSGA